ncbi:ABC transport system integral membrane protein [Rhodococcus sp. B7740]|uniref:FtsX-like permease family protein n=1 Tax=Rhodococcus sp. B7740 TaxID=1564114 RepID=UPI0005D9D045|nr:FtsX-like permease family protein [Rhodococcus sp. B7740]AJW42365.1 ABC transport system integral membrane protein [Rhodococcus sp. B7740]
MLFGGLTLVLAFVGLLASSRSAANPDDQQFLLMFPAILGSWVLAISMFAIASTVSVVMLARAGEFDTLRRLGATGTQIRQLICLETAVVGTIVAIPAAAAGTVLGSIIFARLHTIGMVDTATDYSPGIVMTSVATGCLVAISGVAAQFGSRQTASQHDSMRRRRVAAALVLAVGMGSSTAAFAVEPDGAAATATAGPGTVLVAIGLALLTREMLGAVCRACTLFFKKSGVSGYLATINAIAVEGARPTAMFLTLFVGVSVGTLTMQHLEDSSAGVGTEGQLMASINYSVVGLVAAFMAIALINNLVASIGRRSGEFGVMYRIGATSGQTVGMLMLETAVAVLAAGTVGTIGAVLAVVPYAYVKSGSPLAALSPTIALAVLAVGTVLAMGVTFAAGRRTINSVVGP